MIRPVLTATFIVLAFSVSVFAEMPESHWAQLDGNKIHYFDTGKRDSDKALVFVHGWTCNAEFWKESFNAFPDYRVITIDLPGHGKSDKPTINYPMEHFAKAVEAVLRKAKVNRSVLAGHSMGTPVIRQFYRLFPEKTAGLVIVDGALRPYIKSEIFEQFFAPIRADYEKNIHTFLNGMLTPIKVEARREWIKAAMLSTPGYVAISAMDGMGDDRIWTTDQINVPVLAVMAESPAWKTDEESFFRSIAPNLRFVMWKDVSHFLMMDRPKEFNALVADFIKKGNLF